MTTRHCPDCHEPVDVSPSARDGRCEACRPRPERRHSQPRPETKRSNFYKFVDEHRRATQ